MILPETSLTPAQVQEATTFLLNPQATAEAKAGFLAALDHRGETPAEIAAFVQEFLKHAIVPPIDRTAVPGPMLDVVGTGGDKLNLFNVSTTCLFVLAAGGVCIVKHGNRGITSQSGGADVLEAMGIKIDLPPERTAVGIQQLGLGFLFAPIYHPAFKAVTEARKLLAARGQRSLFNILGPLLNPVRPDHQLIGVFDRSLITPFAEILISLGRRKSWVVNGLTGDGRSMDELSTIDITHAAELQADGTLSQFELHPADHGLSSARVEDLAGGDAVTNADLLEGILAGRHTGPRRDIVTYNAAAGFVITGKATDLREGLALANDLIDRGAAHAKLRALQDFV
jgi:anthranilate phosphoribosyltransferase